MATIIKEISVDVARLNRFSAIIAKQYDRATRFLKVTLLNESSPLAVDASAVVLMNARRPDDSGKSFAGEVNSDGTVTVPITYWMLELDGTVKCDISIITNGENVLTTTLFELAVEQAANGNSEIESSEDYGILITLINQVQEAANAEEQRIANEKDRAAAETLRANAETSRATAEKSRVTAETSRVTAESDRNTAETARTTAETQRDLAESARASAEIARIQSENSRVDNENKRILAEKNRESLVSQAVQLCLDALSDVQVVTAPVYIVDTDTGNRYQTAVQVRAGKPVLIYNEIVN